MVLKAESYSDILKGKMVTKGEEYTELSQLTNVANTASQEASRKRKRRKAKDKCVILNLNDNTSSIQDLPTQMDTIITKSHPEKLIIGSIQILIDYSYLNGIQIMKTHVATSAKKLLILDVNGLLADIVSPPPKDLKSDKNISRRAIFKRPFLDDFLRFCFQRFDVAIWSSRTRKVLDPVVDYLLGDLKKKLLFLWDLSHCTNSSARSLENVHKFIVFKEVKKIWEKIEFYDESNTLLLDDSPYKALLNPKHTGVFPFSYTYKDTNDNSLGPNGDLRVYLEGVGTTENVKTYVEQHPFGQNAIAGVVGKTLLRESHGQIVGWNVETDDHSCTLQEAFEKVNRCLGFNIELKFDDYIVYEKEYLIKILQIIMKVVYEYAQERPVMFSSFQPDVALIMKKLQTKYPVYFLTNGGTEIFDDVRMNSLEEAKKLAINGGLDGIVSEVKGIFRNPSVVREIKESNLSLLTYGKLNNVPEAVHVQYLMGVEGVIVDLVQEITTSVANIKTTKAYSESEKKKKLLIEGEEGELQVTEITDKIELAFLLNLISQVIQH